MQYICMHAKPSSASGKFTSDKMRTVMLMAPAITGRHSTLLSALTLMPCVMPACSNAPSLSTPGFHAPQSCSHSSTLLASGLGSGTPASTTPRSRSAPESKRQNCSKRTSRVLWCERVVAARRKDRVRKCTCISAAEASLRQQALMASLAAASSRMLCSQALSVKSLTRREHQALKHSDRCSAVHSCCTLKQCVTKRARLQDVYACAETHRDGIVKPCCQSLSIVLFGLAKLCKLGMCNCQLCFTHTSIWRLASGNCSLRCACICLQLLWHSALSAGEAFP